MSQRSIVTFENGKLPIVDELNSEVQADSVTYEEAKAIVSLKYEPILAMGNGDEQLVDPNKWAEIRNDKLYLGRYIGLISIGDLDIEIRPKVENTSKTKKDEFEVPLAPFLLFNLDDENEAFLPTIGYGEAGAIDSEFFDRHARQYILNLGKEISFGLKSGYTETEAEVGSLRGRIVFEKLAQVTTLRPHLLPCRFDEFSPDTLHNQVLKQALSLLVRRIKNPELRCLGESLLMQLECVSDTNHTWSEIKDLEADRLLARYDKLIKHAKLTIKSHFTFARSTNINQNDSPHGFVMVWDIERLYERHAFKLLSKVIPKEKGKVDKKPGGYFLTKEKKFNLQPDITVTNPNGDVILIVDTKWKPYGDNIKDVMIKDAYQMHAYANCLRKSDQPAPAVALLYPSGQPGEPILNEFTNLNSKFLVCSLPLDIKEDADGKIDYYSVDFTKVFGQEICKLCGITPKADYKEKMKPAYTRGPRKRKNIN